MTTTEQMTPSDALKVLSDLSLPDSPAMTEVDMMRRALRDVAIEKIERDQETLSLAIKALRRMSMDYAALTAMKDTDANRRQNILDCATNVLKRSAQ